MTISTEEKITFKGRQYHGAKEIGVLKRAYSFAQNPNEIIERFVVHLYASPAPEPRGTYSTVLPISSQKYRNENPDCSRRSGFEIVNGGIKVFDDLGCEHLIGCSASLAGGLASELTAWGLVERSNADRRQ